ncbi:MAG: GTP-binding protein, partial [Alphaproteobacteria bacterium]
VRRQLAAADLLVLNKLDLVASAALAELRTWIERTAPGVRVIETVQSAVPAGVVLGPVGAVGTTVAAEEHPRRGGRTADPSRESAAAEARTAGDARSAEPPSAFDHARLFETWTVVRADPVPRSALERFAAGLGDGVHRAKGFVRIAEAPSERLVYQQVGRRWTVEPVAEGEPRGGGPAAELPAVAIVVVGQTGATSHAALDALLEFPGA